MSFQNNPKMSAEFSRELEKVAQLAQSREIIRFYNSLTERCFHGCVTDFTNRGLTNKEEICVYR